MKDTSQAIVLFMKAKEFSPDKIDAYYGLALMLHLNGKNNDAKTVLEEMEKFGAKTPKIRDNKKINQLKTSL